MKKKNIKIIIYILVFIVLVGGIYLYNYRDFIDLSFILGNSSTYNKNIHELQTSSSVKMVTFNPDSKKKVYGDWFFLEYKNPIGDNVYDYFYKEAGHTVGRYTKDKIEVYYNGKLIKTFKGNSSYFYVKQNWAGHTVVLKLIGKYPGNNVFSKYLRLHIPAALKLSTVKYNNEHYYIVKNAKNFYSFERKNKFYQKTNDAWSDSCLGFSEVYANAIKTNNFSIIKNQTGLNYDNDPYFVGINGFKRGTNFNKNKVVKFIYKQLIKNNPVVLQVNGNTEGTSRHYVVVIGYRVDFDVNRMDESDFLILDVWDGDCEVMSGKGGKSGVGDDSYFMITGLDTVGDDSTRNYGYEVYYMY